MQFIDTHHDQWHTVGGEDGQIDHPPIKANSLLTLAQWHAVRDQWPAKSAADHKPVGVILTNDTDVEVLEADLSKLSLVVLQFPKWTDGRAYTQAHILKSRYRFGGGLQQGHGFGQLGLEIGAGFGIQRDRRTGRRRAAKQRRDFTHGCAFRLEVRLRDRTPAWWCSRRPGNGHGPQRSPAGARRCHGLGRRATSRR